MAATVRNWQSAWKPVRQEMSAAVQVELFGELLVLNSLMIPCIGPAAVDQWSGPDTERHDFVSDRLHLEVKTTRKSRPEHEISRLDQLTAPAGCRLLFVSIQVEQSVGGSQTSGQTPPLSRQPTSARRLRYRVGAAPPTRSGG